MRASVELWVRLKVIDLVAQTAWITFTEKLDFADRLRGMVHYWYWGMQTEGVDLGAMLGEIDRVIRADSAFTNQNKHLYRLRAANGSLSIGDLSLEKDFPVSGDAPSGGAPSGGAVPEGTRLFAFDCLVREKRPDREIGYAERLGSRLRGVTVSDMKFGEAWRLIARAPSREAALADVERMLVSRSRREGLLLNPHYQQYEIMSTTPLERSGSAGGWTPAKE